MSLSSLTAPTAEALRELPMPEWVFGAMAFGTFLALLGLLWSFRNTAAKTGQHERTHH